MSSTEHLNPTTVHQWNGTVFSRHNRSSKYWSQKRLQQISLHAGNDPRIPPGESIIVAVFVRTTITNMVKKRNDFLKYMGGQNHVLCDEHRYPLITSYLSKSNCSIDGCRNKDYLCCPDIYCESAICKRCYDSLNKNESYLIRHGSMMIENAEDGDDGEDNSSYESQVENEYDEYDYDVDDGDDSNLDDSDCDEVDCNEHSTDDLNNNATSFPINVVTNDDNDNYWLDDEFHHFDSDEETTLDG